MIIRIIEIELTTKFITVFGHIKLVIYIHWYEIFDTPIKAIKSFYRIVRKNN